MKQENNYKKAAAILIVGFLMMKFLTGCASAPATKGYEKDQVLSTLGDRSIPDWAEDGEAKPFVIKDGKAFSVGVTTLRGDERPEAGLRIAENNARAHIAKAVENKLEFVFQNSEENASLDSTQARYIGSELSSLTTHSIRVEGAFWKRFAQSQEDGSRHIYYKLYSMVSISESELKQAINEAMNKGVATHKLSEDFSSKVNKQWDRFVEGAAPSTESVKK